MSYLIGVLVLLVGVMWVCLANPTASERANAADTICPKVQPIVRYPAHLGGPHPAVCRPTGVNWR